MSLPERTIGRTSAALPLGLRSSASAISADVSWTSPRTDSLWMADVLIDTVSVANTMASRSERGDFILEKKEVGVGASASAKGVGQIDDLFTVTDEKRGDDGCALKGLCSKVMGAGIEGWGMQERECVRVSDTCCTASTTKEIDSDGKGAGNRMGKVMVQRQGCGWKERRAKAKSDRHGIGMDKSHVRCSGCKWTYDPSIRRLWAHGELKRAVQSVHTATNALLECCTNSHKGPAVRVCVDSNSGYVRSSVVLLPI